MPVVVLVIWMIAGRVAFMVMMRVAAVLMVVRMFMPMTVLAANSVTLSTGVVMVTPLGGAALGLRISPAFGIERRLKCDHPSPETLGHRLEDGIAADAQRLRQHFGR